MNHRILFLALFLGQLLVSQADEDEAALRVGFPRSCLNEKANIDSQIAIGVFAALTGTGPKAPESGEVFETDEELLEAITVGRLDVFAMNPDAYLDSLSDPDQEIIPILIAVADDSPVQPLLLVAPAEKSLSDLKGKTLIIDNSGRGSTPRRWIGDFLRNTGQGESAAGYFSSVEEVGTASSALLPVYFGKRDAAILSEHSFESMCQLNPQLRVRLHVVARSKAVASTLVCLRGGFRFSAHDLIAGGEKFRRASSGGELLELMGATRLIAFKEEYLLYDREIYNRTTTGHPRRTEGGGR